MTVQSAIKELDQYAKMNVRHSKEQYAKHGTLHSIAEMAFDPRSEDLWKKPWVPWDFDIGEPYNHPVYQAFTEEQKLAWNHLQWGLEYTVVGQGERQIITLNNYAVRRFAHVLPSVVELENRESFEEVDHLEAFQIGLDALYQRYLPDLQQELWSISASGFRSNTLNRMTRHIAGRVADRLLGTNFPTFFFLVRGLKTHNYKPFENAIASFDEAPHWVRQVSHLHRLDESRHMATALNIAKFGQEILGKTSWESKRLFKLAVHSAWPKHRMAETRLGYWKTALYRGRIFANIPTENKDALFAHITKRTQQNLLQLHPRQVHLTRQANKRIVEEAALSPELKTIFLDVLRNDPIHRNLVDAVSL